MQSRISSSLLQFSVSHDLLEIITIYLTQETFLIIINVKNNLLLHILCGNGDALFQDFLINIKFNEQDLFAFIKYIK